jgi:hypothetical protein
METFTMVEFARDYNRNDLTNPITKGTPAIIVHKSNAPVGKVYSVILYDGASIVEGISEECLVQQGCIIY